MRYFAAVADAGKVSVAATRLYLTQPALSQALRQLEQDVGVELLRRHPRGVELTAAGRDFLIDARACMAAADRAVATAARHARGHNEHLVVGVFLECFPFLIEPLQQFGRARPDVHVQVRELDFVTQDSALREGRVDIAVLCPPPPDAHVHPLHEEPMIIALPAGHRLAGSAGLSIDAIGDEVFPRLPAGTPVYWREHYTSAFARDGRALRVTDEPFASPPQAAAAVAAGRIVSPGPRFVAARYAQSYVATVPLRDMPPVVVGFAWRRATPAVRAFVECARAMSHHAVLTDGARQGTAPL